MQSRKLWMRPGNISLSHGRWFWVKLLAIFPRKRSSSVSACLPSGRSALAFQNVGDAHSKGKTRLSVRGCTSAPEATFSSRNGIRHGTGLIALLDPIHTLSRGLFWRRDLTKISSVHRILRFASTGPVAVRRLSLWALVKSAASKYGEKDKQNVRRWSV